MGKEIFYDQFERSGSGGIPGDGGQSSTQWEYLTTLREGHMVLEDYASNVATYILPLEHQYMLLVQQSPEQVKALLQEQQQVISAYANRVPSRPFLVARLLDERVGSYLQGIAAQEALPEGRNFPLWYDAAYGF